MSTCSKFKHSMFNNYLYENHNKWPPCYHTNDGWGTGLGKGRDNGGRGLRHDMSRAPQYGFFFFFYLYFLSTKYLFALRTTHHLHLQNEHMLETQMCLEFWNLWYVKFFLSTTNDYWLLDCMYGTATRTTTANGHHLWDDEWGLEMHHLHLKSGMFFLKKI